MGGLHCETTSGPSQELTIPLNKLHFWRLANSEDRCDDLDALAANIIIREREMPVAEHRLNDLHSLDRLEKAFHFLFAIRITARLSVQSGILA